MNLTIAPSILLNLKLGKWPLTARRRERAEELAEELGPARPRGGKSWFSWVTRCLQKPLSNPSAMAKFLDT